MIILKIALTLTEYGAVLKDLLKSGKVTSRTQKGGDVVESWAEQEIIKKINQIRSGGTDEEV